MIVVSVTPRRLTAGRQTKLEIRLSNTGDGPCRNIVFTLGTPPGSELKFVGGGRFDIPVIGAHADVVRPVTVEAARPGEYALVSPNFSYRDEDDRPVRERNWRAVLALEPKPEPEPRRRPAPAPLPAPRMRVEHESPGLAVREWAELPVLVRNPGGVIVSDVSVTIDGPIHGDGRRGRIAALAGGKAARLRFNVLPTDSGLVPLTVRLTYRYADESGMLRPASQEEQLHVPVGLREDQRDGAKDTLRPQTVLFLAASPKDMPPLRQDLEFKGIQRERQLSPNRDKFALAEEAAAQLDDVHRALLEYRPDVLHFSGHGERGGGIYLEDGSGNSEATDVQGLAGFLGLYRSTIRGVLVNACHSGPLAQAVSRDVEWAIGMNAAVGDNTSLRFSVSFYRSLFAGESVPDAFSAGRRLVQSDQATSLQYQVPELYQRGRPY